MTKKMIGEAVRVSETETRIPGLDKSKRNFDNETTLFV